MPSELRNKRLPQSSTEPLDAYWTGHDQHHTRSSRLERLAYRLTA
ncbi:hypothetical protein OG369_38910 [Streptomyces sp. NBC_01221]|nr:hypothetical protein [Streptomyces sp. NBC_01221]MCX4791831.1 hypothetical protein [Streptomyces sp. NBC_01221]